MRRRKLNSKQWRTALVLLEPHGRTPLEKLFYHSKRRYKLMKKIAVAAKRSAKTVSRCRLPPSNEDFKWEQTSQTSSKPPSGILQLLNQHYRK